MRERVGERERERESIPKRSGVQLSVESSAEKERSDFFGSFVVFPELKRLIELQSTIRIEKKRPIVKIKMI